MWSAAGRSNSMKTIGFGRYGPPEVLEFRDIGMPVVRGDGYRSG
jgi:hypothetical protein